MVNCETMDHILLDCKVARALSQKLLNEAGSVLVFPARCKSVMVENMVGFGSNKMAKVLW